MNTDKIMSQHDLDERNSLGRATPAEWSTFISGKAAPTAAALEGLTPRQIEYLKAAAMHQEMADNYRTIAANVEIVLGARVSK